MIAHGILFRCHSIGELMGEPKKKGEVLSDTAKSAVREMVAQDLLGVDFVVDAKEMEKGIEVEPRIIDLINRVRGLSLVKNTERKRDEYLSGECDLWDAATRIGRDAKAAWSAKTFPILWEDVNPSQRRLYEWQCRAYMRLWDARAWWVEYGLVDTPERLIRFEPLPLHLGLEERIPDAKRLTGQMFVRDLALEAQMIEKIEAARDYYAEVVAEFDRTHSGILVPQAVAASSTSAPLIGKPSESVPAGSSLNLNF